MLAGLSARTPEGRYFRLHLGDATESRRSWGSLPDVMWPEEAQRPEAALGLWELWWKEARR